MTFSKVWQHSRHRLGIYCKGHVETEKYLLSVESPQGNPQNQAPFLLRISSLPSSSWVLQLSHLSSISTATFTCLQTSPLPHLHSPLQPGSVFAMPKEPEQGKICSFSHSLTLLWRCSLLLTCYLLHILDLSSTPLGNKSPSLDTGTGMLLSCQHTSLIEYSDMIQNFVKWKKFQDNWSHFHHSKSELHSVYCIIPSFPSYKPLFTKVFLSYLQCCTS